MHHLQMDVPFVPRIISADIVDGDILITFTDGKTARFPARVLYADLPKMTDIFTETPNEQWPRKPRPRREQR